MPLIQPIDPSTLSIEEQEILKKAMEDVRKNESGLGYQEDSTRFVAQHIEPTEVPFEIREKSWGIINRIAAIGKLEKKDLAILDNHWRLIQSMERQAMRKDKFSSRDWINQEQTILFASLQIRRSIDGFEREMSATQVKRVEARIGAQKKPGWVERNLTRRGNA